ncbi:MAG: VOC family protein [Actinobacteria bacterium]|nr:VOC family protein [Actinomycetota bacterium]
MTDDRTLHHVVIDCRDPAALAAFYADLIGVPIVWQEEDWVVIATNDRSSGIAFQLAPDHQPPQWPDPDHQQQLHLDIMVDDIEVAEPQVLELGARRLSRGKRVYADPQGHTFCLIRRPEWAAPVGDKRG